MVGLGSYYEIQVTCQGQPDRGTGYVADIKAVDRAVRDHAISRIAEAFSTVPQPEPARILRQIAGAVRDALDQEVVLVRWKLSPYYALAMEIHDMERVLISQQFDFAAAHRLHNPELSDDQNEACFGRCNNRNGHGHNYRLEVVVSVPLPDPDGPRAFGLGDLERIVDDRVIQRFDHTNLNLDTAEFADVIPSVEHIAKAAFDLLADPIVKAGGSLRQVTLWETEKTSCTYQGPSPA